jgi:hypothetical protein
LNQYLRSGFLIVSAILLVGLAGPVSAGIPVVNSVVVRNSGGHTILDVNVSHTPETSFHHLNSIQVDIGGNVQNFPVDLQSGTTFVVSCDVGAIGGTPTAMVQAHCSVDGWGPTFGPVQVPEFSTLVLMLMLVLSTSLVTWAFRRTR